MSDNDYTATDAVVKDDSVNDTASDDKPFSDYTDVDWQGWDASHDGEFWIAYKDSNGDTHRVPVWYYQTLGL